RLSSGPEALVHPEGRAGPGGTGAALGAVGAGSGGSSCLARIGLLHSDSFKVRGEPYSGWPAHLRRTRQHRWISLWWKSGGMVAGVSSSKVKSEWEPVCSSKPWKLLEKYSVPSFASSC